MNHPPGPMTPAPSPPRRACVYHMTHPYFFAHHHLHRRKVEVLRAAGIPAWCLAVVPEAMYQEHRRRYEEVLAAGYTKIVRVRDEWRVNRGALLFLAREAALRPMVLVHALRCDPTPVIRLRGWPVLGRRVRFLMEYEGHQPAELVYQEAYREEPRPPEEPPDESKAAYEAMLSEQRGHAQAADGLVLMSPEHIAVWEKLLGRPVRACCLPTLPDPARIRFDASARSAIRAELGLEGRSVLAYAGNAVCKWQRFDAMCRFVARLAERRPEAWFLALVRVDDLGLARDAVARHGIAGRSTVLHAPEGEVSGYLSAADAGLFLRHDHTMNRVVTSGKLGEYLAAGLPVVTTGANTEVLNEFIRSAEAGVFLPDSLEADERFHQELVGMLRHSSDPSRRGRLSQAMTDRFSGERDYFRGYTRFVREIMA